MLTYRVNRLVAHIELGFDLDSDLFICHTCDNPGCINSKHLFIGSAKDNAKDMVKKGDTKTTTQ